MSDKQLKHPSSLLDDLEDYETELADLQKSLEVLQMLEDDQYTLVGDQIRRLERETWKMIDNMNETKNDQLDTEEDLTSRYNQVSSDIEAVSQEDIDYIFQSM